MTIGDPDRIAAFVARRGGSIGTGGLGAVALRWDHWTDFSPPLIEINRAHGVPWSWAHYSLQQVRDGHAMSWEQIQQIALEHGVELWGHSQTHSDTTTTEGFVREILTSRDELQAALPASVIEGFAIPGVGGTLWNGFTPTTTIEHFTGTEAGRLVLDGYAVSTGHIRPHERVLDGVLRQGLVHYTIERWTAAQTIEVIETARDTATGVSLMLHPHRVGTDGYLPLADYEQIVAFIAAERDADRLLPLTLGGLTIADVSHADRHDLLTNGDFEDGLAGWETQGWEPQRGRVWGLPPTATTATTRQAGATLSQTLDAETLTGVTGGVRELVVQAWSRGARNGVTLRVQAGENAERTVVVPAGREPQIIRVPHLIDVRAQEHTVTLTMQGEGQVSVRGVRLQAV